MAGVCGAVARPGKLQFLEICKQYDDRRKYMGSHYNGKLGGETFKASATALSRILRRQRKNTTV